MLADPYEALEFEGVVALLRRYIASPPGSAKLAEVLAAPRLESARAAEAELALVGEAVAWLADADRRDQREAPPVPQFAGIEDVGEPVRRLALEGVLLEPAEIRAVVALLGATQRMREALLKLPEGLPLLRTRGEALPDFRAILAELSGKILPDDTIADTASSALSKVRRKIGRQREVVEGSLERFVRKHATSGVLRDKYVTMRNGRTVVPVKASSKSRVDGVVHGASSSGQTVYVEPFDTIVQNNRLVRLREDEHGEILRILRELSARLRDDRESIEAAVAAVGELEYAFARARFCRDFACCLPRFMSGSGARIVLEEARHPLLQDLLAEQGRRPVPLSLRLESGRRTMIVSGPNAGGKTVVLKTVGALAAMAQAGIPVPAEAAEFPWFEEILADIGDAQSISESLSTFSAHVSKLTAILARAAPRTLAVLDELGTATDPEDGGALAVAVVERLQASGGFAVVSTHLPEVKMYSARADGVVSASMGFDDASLSVTYRLHSGIPGQSAGIEMADRFGLPADVVNRARDLKGRTSEDAERFLADLRRRVAEHDDLAEEARRKSRDLDVRKRELEREAARRADELRKEAEDRIEALTKKLEKRFQQTLDAAVRKVQAAGSKAGRDLHKRAAQSLGGYRRAVSGEVRSVLGDAGADPPAGFAPGDRVRVASMGVAGEVVKGLENGQWIVQAGAMRLQVATDDLVSDVEAVEPGPRLPDGVRLETADEPGELPAEINVIGLTSDEALADVDKFLDRAVLANRSRLRVVHGFGKNVLRRELWRMFASHAQVAKYYQAEQQEGGAGATIVEVRDD